MQLLDKFRNKNYITVRDKTSLTFRVLDHAHIHSDLDGIEIVVKVTTICVLKHANENRMSFVLFCSFILLIRVCSLMSKLISTTLSKPQNTVEKKILNLSDS